MSQLQLQGKSTPVASVKDVTPEVGERQDLVVPYKDRAEAKAAGAKWDKKKPGTPKPGLICKKLAKWKPENVVIEQSPAMTLQEEVETALKDIGCILDTDTDRVKHPIMDEVRKASDPQ